MGVSVFSEYSSEIVTTVRKQQLNNNSKEESINMGYLSFAVIISVASFTLFGTTLNEASAEPILARWNDNVAVDLGLEKRSDPVLVTTKKPTFKEHADHTCSKQHGPNSAAGVEAGCAKDPKCPGYTLNGNKGKRCKGELKFGDGTEDDTTGMKGMKAKTGKKVFIKEHCADGLKNQDEEDVDCGGEACEACALANSCGKQPSCKENGAAPDCPDAAAGGACKCGSADGCMVATADTAPVCVDGTCKCSKDVDACTGGKKCVGGKCVDAACGKAAAACPTDEVCDSDACKCPDKNNIKGPTCAGNPGGEVCDKTAEAPTCKCSADQDSCSGNLLAPNCNAEAPQDPSDESNTKKGVCECAPGKGACPDGTLCVDKKCMCGDIAACEDPKAPTCDFANSQCMCGTGPGCADMPNADKCDDANNKCVCGTTGDACDRSSGKPICKDGVCVAKK